MDTYLRKFYQYLDRDKELSTATISNYAFYLERFFSWSKIRSPKSITAQLVSDYSAWLKKSTSDHEKLDQPTINYHLIALRSLLTYFFEEGIESLDPEEVTLKKLPLPKLSLLSSLQLTSLLEAPFKTDEQHIIQFRDKSLLEVLCSTGIKVSELSQLKRPHIDTATTSITIKKPGSSRSLKTSNQAIHWLKKYLSLRKDSSPYVFIRHDRARAGVKLTPLTPRSIQRSVKMYGQLAHIKTPVTPKVLRHSYASHLITEGNDLKRVQALLGHAAITTTQRYLGQKE